MSSSTKQVQQSQGGEILEKDHFVSPPYDLGHGEEVGSDAAAAAQRQHLAERRKPDRYIPREKGSKAGRFEADMFGRLSRGCSKYRIGPNGIATTKAPGAAQYGMTIIPAMVMIGVASLYSLINFNTALMALYM
ncbi:hypothetical protein BJ166DRAFT_596531 [Pestalotiopsis sp. NC0098]|nr:hypothetical protein BJ166DRAFT_596531 [Pestalotiopsis sp. NC0098]